MNAGSSLDGLSSDSNNPNDIKDSNNPSDTQSESYDDEFHVDNSRHSIEVPSKKDSPQPPPLALAARLFDQSKFTASRCA